MWPLLTLATLALAGTEGPERTTVDLRRTVWTDDAVSMHDGEGAGGVVAITDADAMITGHVTAGIVQLGAVLPATRIADGFGYAAADARVSLANHPRSGLGFALAARAWRPDGRSVEGGGVEMTAAGEIPLGPVSMLANAGVVRSSGWKPVVRSAIATPLEARFGASAELAVGSDVPEAMTSVWTRVGPVALRLGAGSALPMTASTLRGVASVALLPRNRHDRDADAVVDSEDLCPWDAEDVDGWEDEDGCPDPVRLVVKAVDVLGHEVPGAEWAANNSFGHAPGGTLVEPGPVAVRAWAPRYDASTVVIDGEGGGTRTVKVVLHRQVGDLDVAAVNRQGESIDATWRVVSGPPTTEPSPHGFSIPGWYDIEVNAPDHAPVVKTVRVFSTGTTLLDVTLDRAPAESVADAGE